MKATTASIIAMLCCSISIAQINSESIWTWMKGDNIINQTGSYGILGTASHSNKPGARNYSTTWKDNNGNLWLFGGQGYETTNYGYLNDLWKYNTTSNMWTWVKGSNQITQPSSYGTQGIADATNDPGAIYAGMSWSDNSGNLWLLGGFGYTDNSFGFLNTLWKFNTSTNQWTWVKGDKLIDRVGIYGTKNVANAANKPGARYGSQTWVDANGIFWLYGGYGYGTSNFGLLNDLWKYNPASNQWAWVSGDNVVDQSGVYGTKGVAGVNNKPGGRYVSTSWSDTNGNLWLFGGYGKDENSDGSLNDLWKYNISTNRWTWVSGNKTKDQRAIYGTQGTSNLTNKPGGRYVSNGWIDSHGTLWMFGGYGFDATNQGNLNDLWKFNPTNNEWSWVKGDNNVDQSGIYGTQGLPSTTNKSGARTGSVSWADGSGNLWIFGGFGNVGISSGILNDLWKINSFQAVLPLRLLQFNGVVKNEVTILQWQAELEVNFSHYVIQRSFDGITFQTIGTVAGSGNTGRHQYTFTDADLRNHSGTKVFYRLQLMDIDTKFTYSSILRFEWKNSFNGISAYPNPATTSINLSFQQPVDGKVTVSIINMNGQPITSNTFTTTSGKASISMDVNKLPAGNYIINLNNQSGNAQHSFIKQ